MFTDVSFLFIRTILHCSCLQMFLFKGYGTFYLIYRQILSMPMIIWWHYFIYKVLLSTLLFFWAANKLWAVIMPFSHLSTWFIWWRDFFRRSLYSNWLFCFGLQMFHLMPTPQGSFYVFNDIFRLNYAWRVEIVSWFVLTEMSKNWTTIWKFRFF